MNLAEVKERIEGLRLVRSRLEDDNDAIIEEVADCQSMGAVEYYIAMGTGSSSEAMLVACELESLNYINRMMES